MFTATQTLGRGRYSLVCQPFFGAEGMQSQGVNPTAQFIRQRGVDRLMALHLPFIHKICRDEHDFKMGFRIRWDTVHMAFVGDFQVNRLKCRVQLGSNLVFNWFHGRNSDMAHKNSPHFNSNQLHFVDLEQGTAPIRSTNQTYHHERA